ncbi:tetratricopeptide repeat protein [Gemmata sp. SH-PL17]|uniref:tetratricopeptide repeat protein n=1 Tax=Gemmata sp. SH-PL17 TaxID=1630693 RepID=UPI00078BD485|nr:tetratricopeptide repeat protein [Gemmata sp. SH-PL17]AMV25651.1 tetratricopeptide repeat protein [Gemmata sp. SH-PL17]
MSAPNLDATSPPLELNPALGGMRRPGRVARFFLAPVRFVRRRPFWAVALLALVALFVVGGAWFWFTNNLRAAERAADRWHNAEAAGRLRHCQWLWPDQREVLVLSARIARRTGDAASADTSLERYDQLYGQDETLAFELLYHRAYLGDVDTTAPAIRSHISAGGPHARLAREAVVAGLMTRYRYLEAHNALGEWLDQDPDDTLALLLRGKFLESQMGFEHAIAAYRRVLELDPDLLEARLRLATLFVNRRNGEDAIEQLVVLRERLPDNAQVHILWAKALSLQGRTAEARVALDDCLLRHPDNSDALLERGARALAEGDEQAAVDYLGRAIKNDPGNVAARHQYALALARNRQQAEAKREYETIKQLEADNERVLALVQGPLQRNPRDPALLHELAHIALRAGQVREALRWFDAALQADPEHLPTHQSLVVLYRDLDKPALAARHRAVAKQLSARPQTP